MIDNSKTQTAAALTSAGNYLKNSTYRIGQAWITFCADPGRMESASALADEMDALLKRHLPDGECKGSLHGLEQDVRQEAYLLIVGRYLVGNQALMEATANGEREEIENQIRRSLRGALRSVLRSMNRAAERHLKMHEYGEDVDALPQCACIHPACRTSHWELPFEIQRTMVLAALRLGVERGLFTAGNAGVAIAMAEDALTQSQVAKALGISPQAVHSRLAPVRKHMRALIDSQELPSDENA